jgi:putative membrane protein
LFFDWEFEPGIVIAILLACLVYGAGIARRRGSSSPGQRLRDVAYFTGVGSVFLALESPVDALADHVFWVHQIQHILLRMIAPMLIALSAPQATLVRGLPRMLRGGMLSPFMSIGVLHGVFALLTNAVVVTLLFIAALYVWQYPPIHDAAILDDGIHYTMHVTMLAAGLLFFWRVFDMRPPPMGLGYGKRLTMLLMVMLTQIGLGAYLTLKSEVLYRAYDIVGRFFGMNPLTDELIGGFIIWVPSSMMCLVAAIIVIHTWGLHETRADERRPAWSGSDVAWHPTTGAELVAQARSKNRMLAVGAAGFVALMFGMAIFAGMLDHLNAKTPGGLFAHSGTVDRVVR